MTLSRCGYAAGIHKEKKMTKRGLARRMCIRLMRAILLCVCVGGAGASYAEPLDKYGADANQTSVSGLSSGAFMAAQFDVAWSKHLIGAGIVAGGPFYCAGLFDMVDTATAAQTNCMSPLGDTGPKAPEALKAARKFATEKKIDDVSNLKAQRVYVFSGTNDKTVISSVVAQVPEFYKLAGTPESNIRYQNTIAAGHALITNNSSHAACNLSQAPYINNCGFAQSQDILAWIYGPLKQPATAPSGNLLTFDQREFDPNDRASLWPTGFVYVPTACTQADSVCRVHVAFHGCLQSTEKIGDLYARSTGYNEVADTNRIIVLYPQVRSGKRNPLGCWDFWGYTSADSVRPDFYSREAPQIAAVMRMVQRLQEPKP
jgi:poly(3-hydroxybutyrate) depolymerase